MRSFHLAMAEPPPPPPLAMTDALKLELFLKVNLFPQEALFQGSKKWPHPNFVQNHNWREKPIDCEFPAKFSGKTNWREREGKEKESRMCF